MKGHTAAIREAVFACDETRIVTLGRDATLRVWDAADGRLLLTRVEYERGNWLAFEPAFGYYTGTPAAAEWARIRVEGEEHPLSSYATIFHSPEKVRASLEGKVVEGPSHLATAPELAVLSPVESGVVADRSIVLRARAEDRYGIRAITVHQDGSAIPAERVEKAMKGLPGGRRFLLSLKLLIPQDRISTLIKVRATNVRDIKSETCALYLRYEEPSM
jgi:hypothetical protein